MRGGNILHLGVKELRSLLRDPILLGLMLFSFTVNVYSFATAVPDTLNNATISIVDQDRSQLSSRIVDAFYPPLFQPPALITLAEMDARMDAGVDTFALTIPPDFERDVLAGRSPRVQLNVDATQMYQAYTGNGYINQIVSSEIDAFVKHQRSAASAEYASRRFAERPLVDLALRVRFNPNLTRSWFGSVMEVINQVTLLSIILTGAALIREREHGTIEHLLVMPVTPFEIMTSKIWSMMLVVLVATSLSLALVVQGVLAVPIEGSIALFLAGTALHLFATTSMGIFMATIARSMPQFGMLVMLVLLPLQTLSGSYTPRESMPEFVQYLMLATPNTHFVMLAQAILYRGAGLDTAWPQFLALAVIGGALFLPSLVRFRKTIGTMA
jgi:ABC-2 type transport system permease protein